MTKTETIIDTISSKSHKELCQEVLAIGDTMDVLRAPCDEAEGCTSSEYWPFPTYGDLLFGVV